MRSLRLAQPLVLFLKVARNIADIAGDEDISPKLEKDAASIA
jgi:hypothetical protein